MHPIMSIGLLTVVPLVIILMETSKMGSGFGEIY